jgi:hypothetical protein
MPTVRSGAAESDSQPSPEGPTSTSNGVADGDDDRGRRGITGFAEDVVRGMMKPLDAVLLSRERIQATLDEAAERGRITRTDANELAAELFRLGRQQTDELFERARRTVGVGGFSPFPIDGYDELTVAQVAKRLDGLTPAQLRRVRDYERSHANRKGVLEAIETLLD